MKILNHYVSKKVYQNQDKMRKAADRIARQEMGRKFKFYRVRFFDNQYNFLYTCEAEMLSVGIRQRGKDDRYFNRHLQVNPRKFGVTQRMTNISASDLLNDELQEFHATK